MGKREWMDEEKGKHCKIVLQARGRSNGVEKHGWITPTNIKDHLKLAVIIIERPVSKILCFSPLMFGFRIQV